MTRERPSTFDSAEPSSRLSREPSRLEQKTITTEAFSLKPPALAARAVLVRMDSIQAGQVTTVEGPEVRIGRHPTNAVVVDDDGISRTHARVFYDGGSYFVEDLGSSNGTYVNGSRVDKAALFDGAVVQLGPRVSFRFSIADAHHEQILRKLYDSSVRDGLTGAYNRHFFVERLAAEISYSGRHSTPASILLFDLDHFKNVNDTYGHPAGDDVLKNLSAVTHRLLRLEDVFARYGGEEFVVLLRNVPIRGAAKAAERLRVAIAAAPTETGGVTVPATVSIGCASVACTERPEVDSLIAVADRRLYIAKGAGRNRVIAEG